MCVQEEERLIQELREYAHMVTHDKDKKQAKSPTHSGDKKVYKYYVSPKRYTSITSVKRRDTLGRIA